MSYSYQKVFNATLNALPKNQRAAYKLNNISKIDKQQVSTHSYRPYNKYTAPGTKSPLIGRPYTKDPKYVSGIGITAIVNP